jgi:hypothetical protein
MERCVERNDDCLTAVMGLQTSLMTIRRSTQYRRAPFLHYKQGLSRGATHGHYRTGASSADNMAQGFADNPVINSPFRRPEKHFQLDESGLPTGAIIGMRRKSEFFVPIAALRISAWAGAFAIRME